MKIKEFQLQDSFDQKELSKGYDYFRKNKVLKCNIQEISKESLFLSSDVAGSGTNIYNQHIKISLRLNKIMVSGGCSCPVGFNCKHVIASCLEYIYNIQEIETKVNEVDQWFQKIQTLSKKQLKVSANTKSDFFICYRLFENDNELNFEDVKFYKSKILKNDNLSKGVKIKSENLLYGYNYVDITNEKDKEIISLAKGIIPKYYDGIAQKLSGELGYLLLKKMVATSRCFYKNFNKPLRFSGEKKSLKLSWHKMDEESLQLVSNLDPETYIIQTKPVLFIDPNALEVYELKEVIDADVLKLLLESPKLSMDQIDKAYENLKGVIDVSLLPTIESAQITVEHISRIVFESDYNESGDSFDLFFNIELTSGKNSLVDLVAPLIEEYKAFEYLPQSMEIQIGDRHYLKFEKNEIEKVLTTIFSLYDKDTKKLKLSKNEAHILEDFDKNVTFKSDQEILRLSKKLKNFEGLSVIDPPKSLNANLRAYQQDGLNWLGFLHEFGFGGILADDMGLGKTLQTIAHLAKLKEDGKLSKPALIIMPTSLVANWKNEIKNFYSRLNVLSLYGADRFENFESIEQFDVVLTTYSLVVRDLDILKEKLFSYVILDEAQKIKNPRTKMALAINSLKSTNRLALSGTPIENHLGELWSLFHFLMPGFLGTQKYFKEFYQIPIEKHNDIKKQKLLNKRIQPFMLRRTKDLVAHELPVKQEIIKYTQFAQKQSKVYETIRITMEKKVQEAVQKKGLGSSHITILDALLKLRQVCCDPKLLTLDEVKTINESAKLELFLELVEELLSEGRKILVFSQFTSMLSIIENSLIKLSIKYVKLTGSTRNREDVINQFQSGSADMFLISLKAGGVGLNLVEADTVIHYDPWWNPAVENQATDRAYRIGQTKNVFVYKLIVENTIEEKILELQKKKQSLQDGIYDEKNDDKERFTGKELLELLSTSNK